jgi:hypothetical protein
VSEEIVVEGLMFSRKRARVVDLRTPAAVRLQAEHLRRTLMFRNQGERFRSILAQLSDDELIKMDVEHHAAQVAQAMQSRVAPSPVAPSQVTIQTELIVTPEMREAAYKINARKGGSKWSSLAKI